MASFLRIQLISFLAFVCLLNCAVSMPFIDPEDDENENDLNTEKFEDFLEDIPDEEQLLDAADTNIGDLPFDEAHDKGIINFKDGDDDAFDAEEDFEIIEEPIEDEKDNEGKRDEEDDDDDDDDDDGDDEKDIELKRPEEDNDKADDEEDIEEKKIEEDNYKGDDDDEEGIEEKRNEEDDDKDDDNDKDDEEETGKSEDSEFNVHKPGYFKRMYEKAKQYLYGLGK